MRPRFSSRVQSYFLILVLFINVILLVPSYTYAYSNDKNNNEISSKSLEKLASSYSRKFCNGLAFGLSKESALEFTINENKQLLKKKQSQINDELLNYEIASKIVNDCGYPIGFSGEKGVLEFQKYITEKNKS